MDVQSSFSSDSELDEDYTEEKGSDDEDDDDVDDEESDEEDDGSAEVWNIAQIIQVWCKREW